MIRAGKESENEKSECFKEKTKENCAEEEKWINI